MTKNLFKYLKLRRKWPSCRNQCLWCGFLAYFSFNYINATSSQILRLFLIISLQSSTLQLLAAGRFAMKLHDTTPANYHVIVNANKRETYQCFFFSFSKTTIFSCCEMYPDVKCTMHMSNDQQQSSLPYSEINPKSTFLIFQFFFHQQIGNWFPKSEEEKKRKKKPNEISGQIQWAHHIRAHLQWLFWSQSNPYKLQII